MRKGDVQEDGWTDKADSIGIILQLAWLGWEHWWAVTKWFSGQSLTIEASDYCPGLACRILGPWLGPLPAKLPQLA